MVKVLILYYSRSGRTHKIASAIAKGVSNVEEAEAVIKRVDYATGVDFLNCDAVAFGTPNYFSYMAGLMKDYFDRNLSIRDKVTGKPAAAFSSGGGDSPSALETLEKMITSFRLEKVAEGLVSSGDPDKDDLARAIEIGEKLAKEALNRKKAPTE
jgi:multimeric flavodoxin WrbA